MYLPLKRVLYYMATTPFANFFSSYFGTASYNLTAPKTGKMLEGMKRCYENNSVNPLDACSYYINGFKRLASA